MTRREWEWLELFVLEWVVRILLGFMVLVALPAAIIQAVSQQ